MRMKKYVHTLLHCLSWSTLPKHRCHLRYAIRALHQTSWTIRSQSGLPYPVDIPQNLLDVIDKNIALDADNVFAKIGDVQKTAILLFAEYIDAATTIAAQSGGGGGGATSSWGRDKDEDELSWAHRCAMMANRLCRPRKKQGYGR